jgi:periplasmic mercuric ion binding protein
MFRPVPIASLSALAALALLGVSGCTPAAGPNPTVSAEPAGSVTTAADSDPAVQLVSLQVPGMHCQFACWPKVKETLEQQEGVAEVSLAQQAKENELDNPVVHVRVDGPFDAAQAVQALADAGFRGARLEN